MNNRNSGQNSKMAVLALLLFVAALVTAGWFIMGRKRSVAAAEKRISAIAPLSERRLFTAPGRMDSPGFSSDGKLLAVVAEEKTIYLLNVESGAVVQQISDACCSISSVSLAPDMSAMAIGFNSPKGPRIRVLRAQDSVYRTVYREFRQEGSLTHSVSFSSDGRLLLTEIDSDAVLWNLETGAAEKRFDAGVNGVCALSEDRSTVVTAGSNANEVKLWDVETGGLRLTLEGHSEGLLAVALSPDGTRAVTGSYDGTARLWDAKGGSATHVLKHGEADPVYNAVFSHSGSTLATSSDAVRVWSAATGARIRVFSRDKVTSLAYSPDGHVLAGASMDGNLYLWRLP